MDEWLKLLDVQKVRGEHYKWLAKLFMCYEIYADFVGVLPLNLEVMGIAASYCIFYKIQFCFSEKWILNVFLLEG